MVTLKPKTFGNRQPVQANIPPVRPASAVPWWRELVDAMQPGEVRQFIDAIAEDAEHARYMAGRAAVERYQAKPEQSVVTAVLPPEFAEFTAAVLSLAEAARQQKATVVNVPQPKDQPAPVVNVSLKELAEVIVKELVPALRDAVAKQQPITVAPSTAAITNVVKTPKMVRTIVTPERDKDKVASRVVQEHQYEE